MRMGYRRDQYVELQTKKMTYCTWSNVECAPRKVFRDSGRLLFGKRPRPFRRSESRVVCLIIVIVRAWLRPSLDLTTLLRGLRGDGLDK